MGNGLPSDATAERRPRVARVGSSVSLNTVLRNQLGMLAEQGFEIVCVCDDDEWAEPLRAAGHEVWPLGMGRRPGPLRLLLWTARFTVALRRRPVDVVHTVNAFHGLGGRLAARLARVPVVVHTVHNWYFLQPFGSRRSRLLATLERLANRLSDRVFFQNRDDHALGVERRLIAPEKRAYIGNGIDVDGFRRDLAAHHRAAARAELGLPAGAAVVTMVARLEPPKDHPTLLEAVARLAPDRPEAHLLLVGHGLDTDTTLALADKLGLAGRMTFLGYRRDVPRILTASDVVALVSHQEGMPRGLMEAMVAGLPVVGTDVVGIRDVIRDGETGLLVPPRDPDALHAALRALLADPDLAARLARSGQAHALAHFDERIPARIVGDTYRELLAASDRR